MTFPIDESTFLSHDLSLLESVEFKHRIKHIWEIIEEVNWQETYPDIDPDMLTRFIGFLLLVAVISLYSHVASMYQL